MVFIPKSNLPKVTPDKRHRIIPVKTPTTAEFEPDLVNADASGLGTAHDSEAAPEAEVVETPTKKALWSFQWQRFYIEVCVLFFGNLSSTLGWYLDVVESADTL